MMMGDSTQEFRQQVIPRLWCGDGCGSVGELVMLPDKVLFRLRPSGVMSNRSYENTTHHRLMCQTDGQAGLMGQL